MGARQLPHPQPVAGRDRNARNFLDSMKSRARCNRGIAIGHLSTAATLIGNIAHKTKSYLEWDGKAERFTNNDAANRSPKLSL